MATLKDIQQTELECLKHIDKILNFLTFSHSRAVSS